MNLNKHPSISSLLISSAIAFIIVMGLIHLVTAPDEFTEAIYKGLMFAANGIAAFVAAVGIYSGSKIWGLGLLVAGGAIVMYVVSRTIGLPGLGVDDEWFEPIGVLSLIVEGTYVVLALRVLFQSQTPEHIEPRLAAVR